MRLGETIEINGKISIHIAQDGATIEIEDDNAVLHFIVINLTKDQFMKLASGLSYVDCDIILSGLEHIGKKREMKSITFEIPKGLYYSKMREELIELAKRNCPEGWIVSEYFGSQDSFQHKDNKIFAKTNIYRWV